MPQARTTLQPSEVTVKLTEEMHECVTPCNDFGPPKINSRISYLVFDWPTEAISSYTHVQYPPCTNLVRDLVTPL